MIVLIKSLRWFTSPNKIDNEVRNYNNEQDDDDNAMNSISIGKLFEDVTCNCIAQ